MLWKACTAAWASFAGSPGLRTTFLFSVLLSFSPPTGNDVGGILAPRNDLLQRNVKYLEGAEPCGYAFTYSDENEKGETNEGVSTGVVLAIVLALLLVACVGAVLAWRFGFSKGREYGRFDGRPREGDLPGSLVGNSPAGTTTVMGEVVPKTESEAPPAAASDKSKV